MPSRGLATGLDAGQAIFTLYLIFLGVEYCIPHIHLSLHRKHNFCPFFGPFWDASGDLDQRVLYFCYGCRQCSDKPSVNMPKLVSAVLMLPQDQIFVTLSLFCAASAI